MIAMPDNLILSPLFGDNMIIQQGVSAPVRGHCAPGSEVAVTFLGKSVHVRADGNGCWLANLAPVEAGGPYTMEIALGDKKLTLRGVYCGDVWLAAGQSNMEMPMQRVRDNYPEEWDAPDFPPIHQFKVPQEWDFSGPRHELSGGCWSAASRETLHEFSAVAWFFSKRMYEKRKIPIGFLNAAWGGTPVESWMSREALAPFPGKTAQADVYADQALCENITRSNEAHIREWEALLLSRDRGLSEEWQKPAVDISHWNEITLPGDFADAGLPGFCGVIWLCRDFDVSAELAGREAKVWLGTITDADTVYINGTELGDITYRYPPRKYPIPAGLLAEGKNRIAIRVSCSSGDGCITRGKPFRVFSETAVVELAGTWKYRIGMAAQPRPEAFFFQRQPTGPYNAMIAPLLQFPVKGVIWYQGESNDRCPGEYAALFPALIHDLRGRTDRPELPFIFTQLPIFGEPSENDEASSWALIREAQEAALSLPHTGMAAALDLGEWNDLHPLNKKDVGLRLALAAEKLVFGAENSSPGPLLRETEMRGNRLVMRFDNCGGGLHSEGQPFVSVVSDNGRLRLPLAIEGPDCISVDLSAVENPQRILYAWADNPRDRQLFNSEGLPMLPFRLAL